MSEATSDGVVRRSLDDAPVRVVSVRPGLIARLKNLVNRRELLVNLILSDIKIKYKSSSLGLLWSMISPALSLCIYYLVFSIFLKNGIPNFVIYLFSGLIAWNMYQTSLNTATGVIVDRAGLVKKVSFPREILALANVGAAVVYFVIQVGVLAIFLLIAGHAPAWNFMWLMPIAFIALYLFTAAMAMLMSAITVYLRDVKHLIEVILQLWFYMTPIVYSYENTLSPALHRHGLTLLYFLNPLTPIVLTFQRIFYGDTSVHSLVAPHQLMQVLPTWSMTKFFEINAGLVGIMIVFFLVAEVLFGRLETNFESEL